MTSSDTGNGPAMITHRHTIERKTTTQHDPLGDVQRHWVRYVCTCGHATTWCLRPHNAERKARLHALDGQQSF